MDRVHVEPAGHRPRLPPDWAEHFLPQICTVIPSRCESLLLSGMNCASHSLEQVKLVLVNGYLMQIKWVKKWFLGFVIPTKNQKIIDMTAKTKR